MKKTSLKRLTLRYLFFAACLVLTVSVGFVWLKKIKCSEEKVLIDYLYVLTPIALEMVKVQSSLIDSGSQILTPTQFLSLEESLARDLKKQSYLFDREQLAMKIEIVRENINHQPHSELYRFGENDCEPHHQLRDQIEQMHTTLRYHSDMTNQYQVTLCYVDMHDQHTRASASSLPVFHKQ
ncbi:hypothetical protein [Enterovibrio baiacu]|uniref:hypothetical protein n=1 Tax=Enterovibrio baiacu TaxID=2491023 RepID=UPI003D119661